MIRSAHDQVAFERDFKESMDQFFNGPRWRTTSILKRIRGKPVLRWSYEFNVWVWQKAGYAIKPMNSR